MVKIEKRGGANHKPSKKHPWKESTNSLKSRADQHVAYLADLHTSWLKKSMKKSSKGAVLIEL